MLSIRFRKSFAQCLFAVAGTAVLLGSATLSARPASASNAQLSVIEDSARTLSPDRVTRDAALDEMRALDADIVKIPVIWRNVAPRGSSKTKPRGDLSDPAAYPDGAWTVLDAVVVGAQLRGMHVWFMVTAPAPRWAVKRETSPGAGSLNPDPAAYGEFVAALAKRYASVEYWSIWNEPNLSLFLQPQFKNGVAVSAVYYRKLYRAGHRSLVSNGHGGDTILFGELLPRAPLPRRINGTVPPVIWLREFLCLDEQLDPFRGAQARRHGCNGFKPIDASGFAYHPYTTVDGPLWTDPYAYNATIHHLGRIYKVLDAASRAGHLSERRLPLYNSEFGFRTRPPNGNMVPIARVPAYLNTSELMTFRDRRVATYSQYLLIDDRPLAGFQSGLRLNNGRKKNSVYAAYQLPLMVIRRSDSSVLVWGKLRDGGTASRHVEVQMDGGGSFETVKTVSANRNTGYFQTVLRVTGAGTARFRLRAGRLLSRVATPGEMPVMAP